MSNQQIQHVQSQSKQNNIIRRTTIQQIQPVVTKIEQHISYLLVETSKLKQKSQILQKTTYQHEVINKAMSQLREQMHKIRLNFQQKNKRSQQETIELKRQIVEMSVSLERINSDLNKKQNKITDLFSKNVQQAAKLQKTSENFKTIVQQYALQVTQLHTDNKKLSVQLQNLQDRFVSNNQLFDQKIKERDNKIQESEQKLELYMNQRQQMRKMIQNIWSKVDKAVDIQRYENDWRIIRMQNETMKKQNKRMIDEALTPEVRKFLPEMMERIAQVRKINTLQKSFNDQKAKTDLFESDQLKTIQQLKLELQKSQSKILLITQQLRNESDKIYKQLSAKMQQGKDNASEAIQTLHTQTTQLLLTKQKQIRSDLQNLLPANKQIIYKMVTELVPKQEKEFYESLKLFTKQVLPLIQSTKKQIMDRCDQITKFGQSLQQRLESFNNRIVKIRGDMNVQLEQIKKKSKNNESQIYQIQQNFKKLGKIISIYCQLFLIDFSLSFDPVDKQIYVTYGDGIIYERSETQNEVYYRKFKASRTQIRKSTLASLIKLTDSLIKVDQFSFLQINKNKPSDHFKTIKQAIILSLVLQGNLKRQRKYSGKVREGSLESKLPSIDFNNKTIQLVKQGQENPNKILSQTITSQFSNARKKQRDVSKRRYNQSKLN